MAQQYFLFNGNFFGQNGTHTPGKWCVGTVEWAGAVPCSKDFDTRDEAVRYFKENFPYYDLEGDRGVYNAERAYLANIAKATELMNRARAKFREFNTDYTMTPLNGFVEVEIIWGDWKHDHLFVKHIFSELGAKEYCGTVTEENGSDCYSATYRFIAN